MRKQTLMSLKQSFVNQVKIHIALISFQCVDIENSSRDTLTL